MQTLPKGRGVSRAWQAVLAIGAAMLAAALWRPLSKLVWQVVLALALTALALPFVKQFEKRMTRPLAAMAGVGVLAAALIGMIGLLVPSIISQVSLIAAQAPKLIEWIQTHIDRLYQVEWLQALPLDADAPGRWLSRLGEWVTGALPGVLGSIGTAADAVSRAFLSPILAYYFLRDREVFTYRLSLFIPLRHRKRMLTALREMRREVGCYVRGQCLVALAVALLTALGLLCLGIPAWLALGLLMGVCELIPYVGPIIGGIPIALFALPLGFSRMLWAIVMTVAVQQIEGYVLSPRLMAGATGLHPVWVLLLLSAGGLLWGLAGMMLALPLFVCLRGAARVLYDTRPTA